jgi:hypothetical protein
VPAAPPIDLSQLPPALRARAINAQKVITQAERVRQLRYLDDPVAWAHDCIHWPPGGGLADYQQEILCALVEKRRACVRSPHGSAKSATASIALLWFALTRDGAGAEWKAPTTAGRWHQLVHFLWPEIHKWARKLNWEKIGRPPFKVNTELMKRELQLRHGLAFAMAVADPNALEGAHAEELFYIFDESKLIPDSFFDAAEGAFSTAGLEGGTNAYALALSVPGEPTGRFYHICSRAKGTENWWPRWVTIEESIAAGRVTREWVEQCEKLWGADSALYKNRCLGQFASPEKDGVIPLAWVEDANDRWQRLFASRFVDDHGKTYRDPEEGTPAILDQDEPLHVVGVDVARAGGDKTVFALRQGNAVLELRRDAFTDNLMVTAGKAGAVQDAHGGPKLVVDADGVGAGVYDALRSEGRRVTAFHASAATKRRDASGELGFVNMRAAAWWNMREMLDPAAELDVALPPDDRLTGDLVTPRRREVSGGRIQVESKEDIHKRLARSTDDGDAVVMAMWENAGGLTWAEFYESVAIAEDKAPAPVEQPEAGTAPPVLQPRPKPRSTGGWAAVYAKPEADGHPEVPPGYRLR